MAGIVVGAEDAVAETRAVMERIESILEAGSRDLDSIENMWIYLTDIRDASNVMEVVHEILGSDIPKPTIIGAPLMGRAKVEIQVTASEASDLQGELDRLRHILF